MYLLTLLQTYMKLRQPEASLLESLREVRVMTSCRRQVVIFPCTHAQGRWSLSCVCSQDSFKVFLRRDHREPEIDVNQVGFWTSLSI